MNFYLPFTFLVCRQMNDHQSSRPPHLPHMSTGSQLAGRQADDEADRPDGRFRQPEPRVGLPHVQPGVVSSRQDSRGQGDQAITNGSNGAPSSVRHSVPSLHPAPKLGLPHVSGVTVVANVTSGNEDAFSRH